MSQPAQKVNPKTVTSPIGGCSAATSPRADSASR